MSAERDIEVLRVETLLSGWSRVDRVHYRQRRRDGTWQEQDRDLLNRGDCVTVLLYDPSRDCVLLVRQPRVLAALREEPGDRTLEACSGQMSSESVRECAFREVEEEAGHSITELEPLGTWYASPGGSLEFVHTFLGEYGEHTRVHEGGGLEHEGEDIELVEMPLEEAIQGVLDGTIRDARTAIPLLLLERRVRALQPALPRTP